MSLGITAQFEEACNRVTESVCKGDNFLTADSCVCFSNQRIWNSTYMEEQQQYSEDIMKDLSLEVPNSSQPKELTVEFVVKTAELFPPEAAQGTWPENYSLSDHAPLTVVFSPRRLASNQPVC